MRLSLVEVFLICGVVTALSMSTRAQEVKPQPAKLPVANLDAKLPADSIGAPASDFVKAREPRLEARADSVPVALPDGRLAHVALPRGRVSFDQRDGVLWAAADTYKAAFDRNGMTFVPFFGSQADRSYPLAFALARVGATGPAARVEPQRQENVVRYRRGAMTEVYRLAADHVEQTFEIAAWQGDLDISLGVGTDMRVETVAGGLRFVSPHGHVLYSDAVLVDADGVRHAMQTVFEGGRIALRAGADLLAAVPFPVVVDPVVSVFFAGTSSAYDLSQPDIAFGVGDARYMLVWEFRYSATDYDVLSTAVDPAGNVIPGTTAWIDTSTDSWQGPRIAYNRIGNRFLVVASVTPAAGGSPAIWSRTRESNSTSVGTVQQLSGTEGGSKVNPDVGGDFYAVPPTYFAVVWQRTLSSSDSDIHYRMVTDDGTPSGVVQAIDNSGATVDLWPRIASSDGAGPSGYQVWPVVWHRDVGVHDDILGARLSWDGLLLTPTFAIDPSLDTDRYASVSSPSGLGAERYWLVAYQTDAHVDLDIYMRVYRDGTTPTLDGQAFLGDLEALPPLERMRHQLLPAVDSDGCRFAVAYLEEYGLTDWDVYVSTVHRGAGLRATEARVGLDTSGLFSGAVSVVSQYSGGGPVAHYAAAWDADTTSGTFNSEIRGAIYDGLRPGGYSTRSTACAGLTMTWAAVEPALGATMSFSVGGTAQPRFIILSVPAPAVTLCAPQGCKVGIDPSVMVSFSTAVLNVTIPCDYVLLGGTVAFEGGAVGVAGGCPSYGNLAFTDTVDVTIR
ncbi:MAG: hypothetical protein R3F56_01010 [Planctomycetota bacterium]